MLATGRLLAELRRLPSQGALHFYSQHFPALLQSQASML